MSYHHYTTDGIILKRENRGENDAVYVVFTEMLGLIVAHASGIRLLKSKLRFVLQPGNTVKITLVKGKVLWRITTCVLYSTLSLPVQSALPRLYKLLRTCIVFDEPLPYVYNHIQSFALISDDVSKDTNLFRVAETLTTARVLVTLGMLDKIDAPVDEISPLTASFCSLYQVSGDTLLRHIKNRLGESVL